MRWVRVWLPLAIIVAGLAAIVVSGGSEVGWEGGTLLIAAGLSVWLLNFFFRVGVKGDRDRDTEDRARAFFDEHGHWPDEEPPPPAQPRPPHVHAPPAPTRRRPRHPRRPTS